MSKMIRTYEDLVLEEQRLKAQMQSYKLLIKEDLSAIKDGLNPVKRVVATAKRIFTRDDNGPFMNFGLNFGVDFVLRRILLAKAGWLLKFVVPYVVKNYTSHIIAEEDRNKIVKAVKNLIRKVTKKGKSDEPDIASATTF